MHCTPMGIRLSSSVVNVGHFAGSKRWTTKLHTDVSKGAFESDGARYAYKRVCDRQHPTYGKGPQKVLEPCFAAASLVAPRFGGAAGMTDSPKLSPPPYLDPDPCHLSVLGWLSVRGNRRNPPGGRGCARHGRAPRCPEQRPKATSLDGSCSRPSPDALT